METTQETKTEKAAPAAPEIREEPKPEVAVSVLPTDLTAEKKKKIRQRTVWPIEDLYVDRPVADGGFGSFANDGREYLDINSELVKSLIQHYQSSQGVVSNMIAPIKVSPCGTDDKPLLVVLNGRQRVKGIGFINRLLAKVYEQYAKLDFDKVRLKNVLISNAQAASNGVAGMEDFALLDPEDIEYIVGGRVNGEPVPGLMKANEGPIPYHARVEFSDVDPNAPEALEISAAERISVETPLLIEARQMQRLLDANRSPESVARNFGMHTKTLYNKLLILHVHPEVAEAINAKKISWSGMKDMFFLQAGKKTIPKPVDEQLRILDRMIGVGGNKHQAAAARAEMKAFPEGMKCAGVGCGELLTLDNSSRLPDGSYKHVKDCKAEKPTVTPAPAAAPAAQPAAAAAPANGAPAAAAAPANGQPGVAGSAPTGAPPAAAPKPTAPKTAPKDSGVLAFLPRASAIVKKVWETTSLPDPEQVADAREYYAAKENLARVQTAGAVLAYLGGDPSALGDLPEVQKLVVDAIGQARSDADAEAKAEAQKALEAKGQTPTQKLAQSAIELFTAWEDVDADERGEWPQIDDEDKSPEAAALRDVLGKIQKEYADKLASNDEKFKRQYRGQQGDFARDWVMANLLNMPVS